MRSGAHVDPLTRHSPALRSTGRISICGSHVGGRSLASKVIRAGFFWPTVREDCVRYAQHCKQCHMHADWHKALPEELRSIYNPWPFHT